MVEVWIYLSLGFILKADVTKQYTFCGSQIFILKQTTNIVMYR